MEYIHKEITEKIIKAYYQVYNTLGYGFLEKVYHNALLRELSKYNLEFKSKSQIIVYYDQAPVGEYYADIIVNDSVVLELKAMETLCEEHELQLVNYLKATNIEIGLLLNFGRKPEIRRKIFTNDRKRFEHR